MARISIDDEVWLVFEHRAFDRIYTNSSPEENVHPLNVNLSCRNLVDINRAKEDCRIMSDEYHDKYVGDQVEILLGDISLDEATKERGRR